MFGFLFLCYGLMIVVCAAVTILMTYFLLCGENYNWQWRSFFAAGTTGGYVFLNCLLYLATKIQLGGLAGVVLYVGYSALISLLFFILSGKSPPTTLLTLSAMASNSIQGLLVISPAGGLSSASTSPSKSTENGESSASKITG